MVSSIVLLGLVGLLLTQGDNIEAAMKGFRKDVIKHAKRSSWDSKPKGVDALGSGKSGINGIIPRPGPGHKQICFESGWCLNIPVYDSVTLTRTTGSRGARITAQLIEVLDQITDQMYEGKVDADLRQKMKALAESGRVLHDQQDSLDAFVNNLQALSPEELERVANEFKGMAQLRSQQAAMNDQLRDLNAYVEANPESIPPEIHNTINIEVGQMNQVMDMYNQDKLIVKRQKAKMASGIGPKKAFIESVIEYWHDLQNTRVHNGKPGSAIQPHNEDTICGTQTENAAACLR